MFSLLSSSNVRSTALVFPIIKQAKDISTFIKTDVKNKSKTNKKKTTTNLKYVNILKESNGSFFSPYETKTTIMLILFRFLLKKFQEVQIKTKEKKRVIEIHSRFCFLVIS